VKPVHTVLLGNGFVHTPVAMQWLSSCRLNATTGKHTREELLEVHAESI
jgi:hypothetical protein